MSEPMDASTSADSAPADPKSAFLQEGATIITYDGGEGASKVFYHDGKNTFHGMYCKGNCKEGARCRHYDEGPVTAFERQFCIARDAFDECSCECECFGGCGRNCLCGCGCGPCVCGNDDCTCGYMGPKCAAKQN